MIGFFFYIFLIFDSWYFALINSHDTKIKKTLVNALEGEFCILDFFFFLVIKIYIILIELLEKK